MNVFESDWISLSQSQSGVRVFWSESGRRKLRWPNPRWWNSRWQNSRWLPSSSWVRMNVFESDWISLSESQSGVRVFWSESGRRKQGVWIHDGSVLIQNGRIQDGCHNWVEWEGVSKVFFRANGGEGDVRKFFFVQMVGTNLGKCESVWEENLRWQNSRWQNSRWLPSSSWVRMNEFESY